MAESGKYIGQKTYLNEQRIKALFPALMISPKYRYLTYALNIANPNVIKKWVMKGQELQEEFSDELYEMSSIFPFELEQIWHESAYLQADAEFRHLHQLDDDDKISDRMRLEYNNFMTKERNKYIEMNIQRREKTILDTLTLNDDPEIDEKYKLYIRFSRIFERGTKVKELGYIANIDKHANSSKNVGLSVSMLEKYAPEEWADKQVVQHQGNVNINANSILDIALNLEAQQRQLLKNNQENVIEVKPIESETLDLLEVQQEIEKNNKQQD